MTDNSKSLYASSWLLPPTARQEAAITRLCMQKGIKEPLEDRPSNRWEARQLLYELSQMKDQRKVNNV